MFWGLDYSKSACEGSDQSLRCSESSLGDACNLVGKAVSRLKCERVAHIVRHKIILDYKFILWLMFIKFSVKTIHNSNDQPNESLHDKTNKIGVRPVKTQIRLGIRTV